MEGTTNLWVAVGTALAGGPPHRTRRAELPHRALALGNNAQALHRIGVMELGFREPPLRNLVHLLPGGAMALTAPPQRAALQPNVPITKHAQHDQIARDPVVTVMPAHDTAVVSNILSPAIYQINSG